MQFASLILCYFQMEVSYELKRKRSRSLDSGRSDCGRSESGPLSKRQQITAKYQSTQTDSIPSIIQLTKHIARVRLSLRTIVCPLYLFSAKYA